MDDINRYKISILGSLAKEDIDPFSPPDLTLEQPDPGTTLIMFHADQSALIGFIRQLHGLGIILRSITSDRANGSKAA